MLVLLFKFSDLPKALTSQRFLFIYYRFGQRFDFGTLGSEFVGSEDLDLDLDSGSVRFRLEKWKPWQSDRNAGGEKGEGTMCKTVWPTGK